ncbi:MAG: L,D-transpeptidase family protein [Candidatus Binatia bacterium]
MGWLAGLVLLVTEPAWAGRWTEEDFASKALRTEPYAMLASSDPASADTIIGSVRYYTPAKGDTFLDLARFYGLGYNEIEQANPGVDPWIPGIKASSVTLPTAWIIPQGPHQGVVVNIPEMRLYYFHPRRTQALPQLVTTYPVGLGRDEWRTPQGKFKILGKTKNPTWIIPESIREEHIRERGDHRRMIEGGAPDNPLGKYRLELTMPGYRIHGTDIPWGVGMQVSHGCVRLYPEDIEALFPIVPIGAPGEFLYQPVKIGARDGRIYAEVSPDIYRFLPDLYAEAQRLVAELGWQNWVDPAKLRTAVDTQNGIPTDITVGDAQLPPAGGGPPVPDRRELL